MLPRRCRLAVLRMAQEMNGGPEVTARQLVKEAIAYRRARGWFVWEDPPSTAAACRTKKARLAIPEFEVPVMPDL